MIAYIDGRRIKDRIERFDADDFVVWFTDKTEETCKLIRLVSFVDNGKRLKPIYIFANDYRISGNCMFINSRKFKPLEVNFELIQMNPCYFEIIGDKNYYVPLRESKENGQ